MNVINSNLKQSSSVLWSVVHNKRIHDNPAAILMASKACRDPIIPGTIIKHIKWLKGEI